MGFDIQTSIPIATVFVQGILSFFSPCVLPLIPLYIGYLASGTQSVRPDGTYIYKQGKVLLHTVFFVIGISFAFFLLGLGVHTVGRFFSGNRLLFARIGGILIILFGLYQLGLFGTKLLDQEHRLPFHLHKLNMGPLTALLFGFTFSFAWTPCVGPALASVLLMASSAQSALVGFGLIGVYTLGFTLPFLAVGLFTSQLLGLFKKYKNVVRYTVKIGGVLLILMGLLMVTGYANRLTGYLSSTVQEQASSSGEEPETVSENREESAEPESENAASKEDNGDSSKTADTIPIYDFTLTDQYGTAHTLSDYKGKTVFLNFWATWCGPCRSEMPDIQKLYEKYGQNQKDVVILGVANPKSESSPYSQDGTAEEISGFLEENGYTYPTLMDTTGEVFMAYGISSFPTTYMITSEGNILGYVPGALNLSVMEDIIQQTQESVSP